MATLAPPAVQVQIGARFVGPPRIANGGYAAGAIAAAAGHPREGEVVLRRPVPLQTPLTVDGDAVRAGGEVVAEFAPVRLGELVPVRVDPRAAAAARDAFPFDIHPFPGCYVCGHHHPAGLGIHPGPTASGRAVAAPFVAPPDVDLAATWAALDCPGGWAAGLAAPGAERRPVVLARLAARVDRVPAPGERLVVTGWVFEYGDKRVTVGSALFDARGEALAVARATWALLSPAQAAAFSAAAARVAP